MKVYKGTDKNMQCRGKQYVLGKKEVADGAIRCGNKGFHSCEAPFDVLRYYPNINGNRFFEAEAGGKTACGSKLIRGISSKTASLSRRMYESRKKRPGLLAQSRGKEKRKYFINLTVTAQAEKVKGENEDEAA